MTYPSIRETVYHGQKPTLIACVSPHGADAKDFLAAFPEIQEDPQLVSIWPLFESYLAIERDTGAHELAHAIAHFINRRYDVPCLVAEVTYPRAIVDGGRLIDHCLRHCLPTALFVRLKKDFLALHRHTLDYMEALYQRLAGFDAAYLIDVHTMASFCPADDQGRRTIQPVSFQLLEDYVDQFMNARNHLYQRRIDLITADARGQILADPALTAAIAASLAAAGYPLASNEPYHAAPAFLSYQHLQRARALSFDVPKHLVARWKGDWSDYQLDEVPLDSEKIASLAAAVGLGVGQVLVAQGLV
jgi:hypothetical protein